MGETTIDEKRDASRRLKAVALLDADIDHDVRSVMLAAHLMLDESCTRLATLEATREDCGDCRKPLGPACHCAEHLRICEEQQRAEAAEERVVVLEAQATAVAEAITHALDGAPWEGTAAEFILWKHRAHCEVVDSAKKLEGRNDG